MPAPDETKARPALPPEDEFAGVPSPPRRVPWPALVVLLLSGYLVYHQASDIAYALSDRSPVPLGPAPTLFAPGAPPLPLNRYVRIEGTPDFESAVVLDTQGEWTFRSFFRLLDTDGKLFVQRVPGPLAAELAERNAFVGRLLPLRNVSFSASIRDYYGKHVAATHVFKPQALRAALESQRLPGALLDRLGATVSLAGNDVLSLDVRTPGRFQVELPQEIFTSLENAARAVGSTGARVHGEGRAVPRDVGAGAFAFDVEVSEDRETQVLSALADLASRARILPTVRTVRVRVNDLELEGAALRLRALDPAAAAEVVDWQQLSGARTTANLEIPEDAYLLVEGERPQSQFKALVAAAFLLVFALVNVMALRRL